MVSVWSLGSIASLVLVIDEQRARGGAKSSHSGQKAERPREGSGDKIAIPI